MTNQLPFQVSSIDEVPEALRSHYKETEGGYELNVDNPLRSKVDEFRQNNRELFNKNRELSEQLKALDSVKNIDPAKYSEYQQAYEQMQAVKDKKLIEEGKIEEVLAERTERMRSELGGKIQSLEALRDKLQGQVDSLSKSLSSRVVRDELSRVLSEVGTLKPGTLDTALLIGGQTWRTDPQRPDSIIAMKADGSPEYGQDGSSPLTKLEWAKSLLKSHSYLWEDAQGGGAGGGKKVISTGEGKVAVNFDDPKAFAENVENILSGKAVNASAPEA